MAGSFPVSQAEGIFWEVAELSERLDKAVSARTPLSRREVRGLASRGLIIVNGVAQKDCAAKVCETDHVVVDGRELDLAAHVYLMMNKPRGVVCATRDAALPTVLDLVPPQLHRAGLFPAGRLDKDTEGFVLITNDGDLAHRILSPKSHVPKTYLAELDRPFPPSLAALFAQGMELRPERSGEGEKPLRCLPALLEPDGGDYTRARVVLRQGMYHQVRRMFSSQGFQVRALFREKIGGLALDPALEPGCCRPLTGEETSLLERR